ncbi:unnamed protein product, partial [Symbiodinium pilosum]
AETYHVVSPRPTSPQPTSPMSATSTADIEGFKVMDTPQQTSRVKLWQLVLFSSCLGVLALSTLGVVAETVVGLVRGRPVEMDEQEKPWVLPKDVDCKVDQWALSQEWSDVKLDVCCGQ